MVSAVGLRARKADMSVVAALRPPRVMPPRRRPVIQALCQVAAVIRVQGRVDHEVGER